jgi:hypothetical protein
MYSKHNQNKPNATKENGLGYLDLQMEYPHQGKHINKLLAMMAAIAPTLVEFQSHQVVEVFQISMVINV